jgi:2-haloacid dehalogenase
MAKIDTVVFDLGGVLVDWNPYYLYRKIMQSEEEISLFFQQVCTSDWNEEQDAGRPLSEGTELLVKQFPEKAGLIRAYYERWTEMLGGPIHGTVDILSRIRSMPGMKTYALTNWSAETFPIALDRYEFLHWFDGRVVSGEEKTRKPFPQIYQTLIERFSITPERSVYLDDNQRNLIPAAELGFTALHFTSPTQLAEDLEKLGVFQGK